ncbi:hypothetical protein [Pseudanabaena sp. PCC 6802]|uniref:hypothetical protein n=1 Tax=Pseudanabaena sp. PCC 6802 TaxID=118173 RepID=UPI0003458944|nr:hypothetical protein [Pseudanabaena sp. PCC 6802]
MANIDITSLHSTGLDLFSDDENFMCEISESSSAIINGGLVPVPITQEFPTTKFSPLCVPVTPFTPGLITPTPLPTTNVVL